MSNFIASVCPLPPAAAKLETVSFAKNKHWNVFLLTSSTSELFNDKSNTHEFVNLVKELALPGELTQNRSYDFEFMQVEKPYESYIGANVRLRFVTAKPLLLPSSQKTHDSAIMLPSPRSILLLGFRSVMEQLICCDWSQGRVTK